MGIVAIACYRPKPGKKEALIALTKTHLPRLLAEGLVTDDPSIVGEASDGAIVEIFVWKSQAAIDAAHENAEVQKMWGEYGELCDYVKLSDLKEAGELFTPLRHVPIN